MTWAHFSLVRWAVWLAIIPVAYWFGWIASVAFVSVCSLYANVASDFAAWRADKNPEMVEALQRLDKLEDLIKSGCGQPGCRGTPGCAYGEPCEDRPFAPGR